MNSIIYIYIYLYIYIYMHAGHGFLPPAWRCPICPAAGITNTFGKSMLFMNMCTHIYIYMHLHAYACI